MICDTMTLRWHHCNVTNITFCPDPQVLAGAWQLLVQLWPSTITWSSAGAFISSAIPSTKPFHGPRVVTHGTLQVVWNAPGKKQFPTPARLIWTLQMCWWWLQLKTRQVHSEQMPSLLLLAIKHLFPVPQLKSFGSEYFLSAYIKQTLLKVIHVYSTININSIFFFKTPCRSDAGYVLWLRWQSICNKTLLKELGGWKELIQLL